MLQTLGRREADAYRARMTLPRQFDEFQQTVQQVDKGRAHSPLLHGTRSYQTTAAR